MAIQFITSKYDDVMDKTKIYLEDNTADTQSLIQELVLGNVTHKKEAEQVQLALAVHYARYYADKATNEFIDLVTEKSKVLDALIGKAGLLNEKLEEQAGLNAVATSSFSDLMALLFNNELIVLDETGEMTLNQAVLTLIKADMEKE